MASERSDLTRRKFMMAGSAAIASPLLLNAAGSLVEAKSAEARTTSKPWLPKKWDKETDVVVVGYGGAGVIAAITAHDAGAKVIVLEKTPSWDSLGITMDSFPTAQPKSGVLISGGGGNTYMSSGSVSSPLNADDAARYLYAVSGGQTPMDVCEAWAKESSRNGAWFKEMGIEGTLSEHGGGEYADMPGSSGMAVFITNGGGQLMFYKLDEHVKKRGIEVLFDSPGKELIQDYETREIVGVIAETRGKEFTIKARKGVVLCTGGFEFNDELKNRFLKCWPMKFYGWSYNTGDGIKMAQRVGADLWHMDVISGGTCSWFNDPKYDFGIVTNPKTYNCIMVNKFGNRYCNETAKPRGHGEWVYHLERDTAYPGYSRVPSYVIFDETARLAGPISTPKGTEHGITRGAYKNIVNPHMCIPMELGGYEGWSQDNMEEIKKGWIKRADTIEALAAAIGGEMDAAKLKAAVESYNGYCRSKKDAEFGRTPETMLPVDKPPFYAVPVYPGQISTCGGPMRSAKGEILDVDRNPIPRLYSAGTIGSVHGQTYGVSGGNLGDLCAFGRISGRNVAALQPWDH
jgi:succinate dehydrogenase/fumarate reductase flavoprotein subunit